MRSTLPPTSRASLSSSQPASQIQIPGRVGGNGGRFSAKPPSETDPPPQSPIPRASPQQRAKSPQSAVSHASKTEETSSSIAPEDMSEVGSTHSQQIWSRDVDVLQSRRSHLAIGSGLRNDRNADFRVDVGKDGRKAGKASDCGEETGNLSPLEGNVQTESLKRRISNSSEKGGNSSRAAILEENEARHKQTPEITVERASVALKNRKESLKTGEVEFKPGASPNNIISVEQDPSLYSIRSRTTSAASSNISKASSAAARSKRRERMSTSSSKPVAFPGSISSEKGTQNVAIVSISLKEDNESKNQPNVAVKALSLNSPTDHDMKADISQTDKEYPKASASREKWRSKQSSTAGSVTNKVPVEAEEKKTSSLLTTKKTETINEAAEGAPPTNPHHSMIAAQELKPSFKYPNKPPTTKPSHPPSMKEPEKIQLLPTKALIPDMKTLLVTPPTPKPTPEPTLNHPTTTIMPDIILSQQKETLVNPAIPSAAPSMDEVESFYKRQNASTSATNVVQQKKAVLVAQTTARGKSPIPQQKVNAIIQSAAILSIPQPSSKSAFVPTNVISIPKEDTPADIYSDDEFEANSFEVVSVASQINRQDSESGFIEETVDSDPYINTYSESEVDDFECFEVVEALVDIQPTAFKKPDSRSHFYNYDTDEGTTNDCGASETNQAFTDTESAMAAYGNEFEDVDAVTEPLVDKFFGKSDSKPAWRPNSRLSNIGFEYYPPRPKSPYAMNPPAKIVCKPSGPKPPFASPVGKTLAESANLKQESKVAQHKVIQNQTSGRESPYSAILSKIHYPKKLNQANKKHERWPIHMPGTRSFTNLPLKVIQKAKRRVKEESLIEKTKRRIREESKFRQISRGNWSSKASKFISQRKQPAWAPPYRVPERKPDAIPANVVAKTLEATADVEVNEFQELQTRIAQIMKLQEAYGDVSTPAHAEALIKLSRYWLKLGDYKESLRTASLAKKATKKMILQDNQKLYERISQSTNDHAAPHENFFQLVKHKRYGEIRAPVKEIEVATQLEATIDHLINVIINARVRRLGIEGIATVTPADGQDYIKLKSKYHGDEDGESSQEFPVHGAKDEYRHQQIRKPSRWRTVSAQKVHEEQRRINRERAAKYSENLEANALKKLVKSLKEEVDGYKVPRVEKIMKALDKGKEAKSLVIPNPKPSVQKIIADREKQNTDKTARNNIVFTRADMFMESDSVKRKQQTQAAIVANDAAAKPTLKQEKCGTQILQQKNLDIPSTDVIVPSIKELEAVVNELIDETSPKEGKDSNKNKANAEYKSAPKSDSKVIEKVGRRDRTEDESPAEVASKQSNDDFTVHIIKNTPEEVVAVVVDKGFHELAEVKTRTIDDERDKNFNCAEQLRNSSTCEFAREPSTAESGSDGSMDISPGSTRRNSNEDDFSKLADELFG
ncbi:UNVERIFIED_CONTAM: hypothetical protein HDU68_000653 [Siphonaria sp. JEL0065]|nr:hypothetical protein HDU68_000653 [Siphonaria sp. JEL0065]